MYAGNQKNLQAIGKSQFVLVNLLNKYLQELMKKGVRVSPVTGMTGLKSV